MSVVARPPTNGSAPVGEPGPEPGSFLGGGTSARLNLKFSERRALLLFGELAISAFALALAVTYREWWLSPSNAPAAIWFVTLALVEIVISHASDTDDLRRAANPFHGSYVSLRAWLATVAVYLLIPFLSAPLLQSRAAMAIFVVAGVTLRVAWRVAYALLIRQPTFRTNVAIVGTGEAAATIAHAMKTHLGPEYHVLGCIEVDDAAAPAELVEVRMDPDAAPAEPGNGLPVLGGAPALDTLIAGGGVATLILASSGVMTADVYAAVIRAYEADIRVVPMPVFYEAVTGMVPVEHVGDYWYVALPKMEQDWIYRLAKRVVDVAGALAGVLACGLVFPFVAVAVKLSGPGPVLYGQTRVGRSGREFTIHKFRTMVVGAEADGVPRWAEQGDVRVTPVGRFLRASRLDELPQFWNVLTGQMSLVGPRPERPSFITQLQERVPFYRVRLLVPPGLTGWAQVKQPHASSVEDTVVKLQYDLYYISHQSLYLDLLILLKTLGVVLRLRGV
jgi:exopolysaccharide biosynthesis polyprenyl glycosylphosphotransferase